MNRIVVIEDDTDFLEILSDRFTEEGYDVEAFSDAKTAVAQILPEETTLIITDLRLPDSTGFDILRKLKDKCDIPLVVISGRSDAASRVAGFELGADDFLSKPFELAELVARVGAVLRRVRTQNNSTIEASGKTFGFGPVTFEVDRRILSGPGEVVHLTTAETEILATLLRYRSRIATREILADATGHSTWSKNERSIDVHISNLRKKISIAGGDGTLLRTVRGAGYVLEVIGISR